MAYFDKKTLFCLKPPVNSAMGKKKETANPQVQEVNQPAASTLHTLEWLNQIPSAKVDHVERAQLLTELISKERKAMHKLSHLNLAINDTNDQSQLDPQFSINPYNKSKNDPHCTVDSWIKAIFRVVISGPLCKDHI